jgi:hypothetical protein
MSPIRSWFSLLSRRRFSLSQVGEHHRPEGFFPGCMILGNGIANGKAHEPRHIRYWTSATGASRIWPWIRSVVLRPFVGFSAQALQSGTRKRIPQRLGCQNAALGLEILGSESKASARVDPTQIGAISPSLGGICFRPWNFVGWAEQCGACPLSPGRHRLWLQVEHSVVSPAILEIYNYRTCMSYVVTSV